MKGKDKSTLASTMRYEIDTILSSPKQTIYFDIKAVIHTPLKDIPILYPEALARLRDYVNRFSEVINFTCALPMGTLIHDIYPYKEELEITISFKPLLTKSEYEEFTSGTIEKRRMVLKITDKSSKLIEGNSDLHISRQLADTEQIESVSFQLLNKTILELKALTVGFIARDTTAANVIRYSLTHFSNTISEVTGDVVKGVHMVEGFSEETRSHVIVPQLTRLIDLPNTINRTCGGVYPTGFSYYLDSNYWFVYPLYDTTRFEKSDMTLTIINVPKNRLPGVEKTFRQTDSQLIVLATGKVKHQDEFDYRKGTEGNATRFVDARKVIEGFGKATGNKFVPDTPNNVTEAALKNDDPNPTSQPFTADKTRITSAYNHEYTKLAERAGSKLMIEWENANDALLYPGMPVRYMYLVNGVVSQVYGTLLAAETSLVPVNQMHVKKKFTNTTVLSCFVERVIKNTNVK